jgi:hypothetical protein
VAWHTASLKIAATEPIFCDQALTPNIRLCHDQLIKWVSAPLRNLRNLRITFVFRIRVNGLTLAYRSCLQVGGFMMQKGLGE